MSSPEYYLGLMSGTSLDGADVACCRFSPDFDLVAHYYAPMPASLRELLLDLQSPSQDEIHRAMLAAHKLTHWYADTVVACLQTNNIPPQNIRAIGCHGQTIRHRPADGYSLQLNQPALLAERTGIDVIADFRNRDIAAGGQGAPLVPGFHRAMFSSIQTHRVILNIGGMANMSNLPCDGNASGFDCGPGNVLMDAWTLKNTGKDFDAEGAWASQGRILESLLDSLLSHPFFALKPPKSCGREEFNLRWLTNFLGGNESADDVQATLLEFTALSCAHALQNHYPEAKELYICGGGAKNTRLLARLSELLPAQKIATTTSLGLAVDAVEAAAFAWLAKAFIDRAPGNLPNVTGASGPRILGALYPSKLHPL